MNKYLPHVYVIPEDDRNRQLANGFANHFSVHARRIQVMPPAGGWGEVCHEFKAVYVQKLHDYPNGHVVMLIDFDGDYVNRRAAFEQGIPEDLKQRVFVIGCKRTPEDLRIALGKSFEEIGSLLAGDCDSGTEQLWSHDHLEHNDADRRRLIQVVKPILFGA